MPESLPMPASSPALSRKLILAGLLALVILAFFAFDLGGWLSLESFKEKQADIDAYVSRSPLAAAMGFFVLYVAITGLSIPGAALMTLAAGALFGLAWGTLIVSFASSIGATLAFLASRYLFRDMIQARFQRRLEPVEAGIRREGAFYLFALRLVPAVPFFAINVLTGLTAMRVWTFYWVSQLGMLAGTLVYVNAGKRIAEIDSMSGLMSPGLLGALALLGFFPLVARKTLDAAKRRRVRGAWARPRQFDRNLIVIGAGSAGLVSAYMAAALKAKVTLVEKHRMGGDCLNTGCVPSKAFIRSARLLAQARRAHEFGLSIAAGPVDLAVVMGRIRQTIRQVAPHDSVERYESLGVECIEGEATLTSPWSVRIDRRSGAAQTLTARAIVIAAGARPLVPPIPGLAEAGCLTSDNVWDLRALPRRLVVLGGGPIGCELAQCFARFGSHTTMVEMLPRILGREDTEVSDLVARRLRDEGIEILVEHKALRVESHDGEKTLVCEHRGKPVSIAFDEILCAVGRVPNTSGYGLEELGIGLTRSRTIGVDEHLRTVHPNIFACGDVAGPYQFTHTASHTAWYATVNALLGGWWKFRADFSAIPWATFTDPEVATVGLNETEARERGIRHEVTRFSMAELDRAIIDGETQGFVKVLTLPGRDRILGATIVGEHAGDLIAEFTLAVRQGIGLGKLLGTIHVYPTFSEAGKYAAGNWRKAHASPRLLRWLGRYHDWRRGA